ncbi:DUF533 domain-containing protein [Brevibacillus sp. SYSU BS000544]|uniref:tellurite resistance TerB family protein n=1 Tax=Brevibacillus sp. SYSU BS000544 TaxID=3416443 RepID=UPI003CE49101
MPLSNEKDKHIFFTSIRLMICVGHADGYISQKEISRIYQMVEKEHFTLRERQILTSDIDEPKQPESIVEDLGFLSKLEKLTLLRQLYHMAIADRNLTESERDQIQHIANLLKIEPEKLQQVEEWIMEGVSWRERWKQIVAE